MDFLIAKGEVGSAVGQFDRLSNCAQIAVSLFSWGVERDPEIRLLLCKWRRK